MQLENLQGEFIEMLQSFSHEKMKIYQENIIQTKTHALKETYPLIFSLLGKNLFGNLSQYYIHRYPSYKNTLQDYGEYFPDFLENYFTSHYSYLIEIAQFEWINHVVLHSAMHPPLDTKTLENITEKQYHKLHFILHPASYLQKFCYPILELIDTCSHPESQHAITKIKEKNTQILFVRRKMKLNFVELSPAEFNFLNVLQKNQPLFDAFKTTLLIDPEFKYEEKLMSFIHHGIIVDFDLTS